MSQFRLHFTTNPADNTPVAVLTEDRQVIGTTSYVYTNGLLLIFWAAKVISDIKGVEFSNYSISMGR
ncbi:hypothetical protein [Anabaena sp. CCY 9910]|uniref:hypothetical protein n=1 Tax=Anabaena sp. CCY 9910 TaxID=3103870 RepID=UPI0039E126B1